MFHDNHASIVSSLFTIYEKILLSNYLNSKSSKSLPALRVEEEMAPRPGFGPGSYGRQPHILDRTILPGH